MLDERRDARLRAEGPLADASRAAIGSRSSASQRRRRHRSPSLPRTDARLPLRRASRKADRRERDAESAASSHPISRRRGARPSLDRSRPKPRGCRFVVCREQVRPARVRGTARAPGAVRRRWAIRSCTLRAQRTTRASSRRWLAGQHTRARRPVGHGQVDDHQRARARRQSAHDRECRTRCKTGRHTTTSTDALSLPQFGAGQLDRRFAGHEGVRPRACRSGRADGGVRRVAAVARALPIPRLPARRRAGMRGHGRGAGRARGANTGSRSLQQRCGARWASHLTVLGSRA